MPVIHKYIVSISEKPQQIQVPLGTRLVSAIAQNGLLVVYGLVEQPKETRKETKHLLVVGTGWNFDLEGKGYRFIATILAGSFVWHVIEVDDLPF